MVLPASVPTPTTDPAPRIGLEVHVQLSAPTKLFCACPPDGRHTCPVCQGHPGTLPVPARDAVALGVRAALAFGATVHTTSGWARKHYDWPDLPKGYQLTQGDAPLASDGIVRFNLVHHGAGVSHPLAAATGWRPPGAGSDARRAWLGAAIRRARPSHACRSRAHRAQPRQRARNAPGVGAPEGSLHLARLHLEEDAGRLRDGVPDDGRAGVALIEIVTAPTLTSPDEVEAALRAIHRALVDAGVTEGRLEEGHLRADLNVSLDAPGARRIEIKNVSGFRGAARAVADEVARQRACLAAGDPLGPGTRAWTGATSVPLREKPTAANYRMLDDPDLGSLVVTPGLLEEARVALEVANARTARRRAARGRLPDDVRATLEADDDVAQVWDDAVTDGGEPLAMGRLVQREVVRRVQNGELGRLTGAHLAAAQALVDAGLLAREALPRLFEALAREGGEARATADRIGLLGGMDDRTLEDALTRVLAADPVMTGRWRAGDEAAGRFLLGQAMRATGRKAPATRVAAALSALRARDDVG